MLSFRSFHTLYILSYVLALKPKFYNKSDTKREADLKLVGNLRWRRFRGDGNFNRTGRHDLCNIAHALAHHIAVVLLSATGNWSVWRCGENVSI